MENPAFRVRPRIDHYSPCFGLCSVELCWIPLEFLRVILDDVPSAAEIPHGLALIRDENISYAGQPASHSFKTTSSSCGSMQRGGLAERKIREMPSIPFHDLVRKLWVPQAPSLPNE